MRRVAPFVMCVAGVGALLAPAFAHGDLQRTSPEEGAKLRRPPQRITITLTEAPTRGAEARARDGCKERVPAAVSVDGRDIVLRLAGGRPGKWKVTYRAVSSVDGHQTRDTLRFKVAGDRDCSRGDDEPDDQIDAAGNPGIVANPDPPDDGSSGWLLWVVAGTIVVVTAAFLIRRASR